MIAKTTLFALFVAVTLSPSAGAGQGTITGREPGTWTAVGRCTVVIGVLREIKTPDGKGFEPYSAVLEPRATIAGAFDPSTRASLPVRFFAAVHGSSIAKPPTEGAIVLAVIQLGLLQAEEKEKTDWICEDVCTFMPDESGLVALKGFDDPRVDETLKKIQDARAHAEPDPNAAEGADSTGPKPEPK